MASEHAAMPAEAHAEASGIKPAGKLGLFGWVLYDWAAQPFYTLIVTFLFAPYFANAFIGDPVKGQSTWGFATGLAAVAIAVLSPVAGAIADASGRRKPWIALGAVFFIGGMSLLWFAAPGRLDLTYLVLAGYVIAWIAAEVNSVFVNAIMPRLVPQSQLGRLSGLGAAIGYAGGLVSLIVMVGLVAPDPGSGKTILGLEPIIPLDSLAREGDRLVGPFSALWFLVFVLPFLLFTPDPPTKVASKTPVRDGLYNLYSTAREIRSHANIVRFLIARMIYADGLAGVFTFAGIYAENFFGWQLLEKGIFGIILVAAAMLGAAVGGFIEDKTGPKAVIMGSLILAMMATIGVLSIDREHVFFVTEVTPQAPEDGLFGSVSEMLFIGFAVLVGIVSGPLFSSSRSLMARISPPEKLSQFFGLFAFSGKATAFLAPFLIAVVTTVTGNERLGVGIVVILLIIGFVLLLTVRSEREDPDAPPRFAEPGDLRHPGEIFGKWVVVALVVSAIGFLVFG